MVMNLRNKKGDVTISTIILIVLGLVVLVMLIVGFTKGTGFFFDFFDSGPSDLQTIAKACVGYAQASLTIDFCKYRLIEENGKDELVNCKDERIASALTLDGVDVSNFQLSCIEDDRLKTTACDSLVPDNKLDKVRIGKDYCTKYYNPSANSLVACPSVDGSAVIVGNACKCGTVPSCVVGKKCDTTKEPNPCV